MRKMFDDLLTACRQWDVDKYVHILVAIVLAWLASTAIRVLLIFFGIYLERPVAGLAGAAVAAAAIIWKECFDKRTTGLFDREDLAAGFVGIAIFYAVYCV